MKKSQLSQININQNYVQASQFYNVTRLTNCFIFYLNTFFQFIRLFY